ncbi:MAG: hypothetical protein PVG51_09565, partial [Desulfosarcina sp.]
RRKGSFGSYGHSLRVRTGPVWTNGFQALFEIDLYQILSIFATVCAALASSRLELCLLAAYVTKRLFL